MTALLLAAVLLFSPAEGGVVATVSDSAITTSIKTEIGVNPHVNTFGIHVTTNDGVVTLVGRVEDETQKKIAENIARDTKGVQDVVNKLTVIPTTITEKQERGFKQRASDEQVSAAVRSRMVAHKETKGMSIGVDVVNGRVTLSGVVNTDEQKEHLSKIAADTKGVESVVNNLIVRVKRTEGFVSGLGRDFSDEYVEKKIESAILFTKRLKLSEIGVEVDDGICYLYGVVENKEQKQVAEDIASGYKSIQKVVNGITVRDGGVDLEEAKKERHPRPDASSPAKVVGSKAFNEMDKKPKEEAAPEKNSNSFKEPAVAAPSADTTLKESEPTDEPAPKIEEKPLEAPK